MPGKIGDRLRQALFSIILVIAGLYLYYLAGKFEFVAKPGHLGPGFWPRLILGLIIVLSVGDVIVTLVRGGKDGSSYGESPAREGEDLERKRYPLLLYGGMAMTLAYVYLTTILGFALTTFLYLVGFMYLGRYRRPGVVLVASLVGTLCLMLIFVKIVYISLPPGITPFNNLTFWLYALLGIR
ncbi:MAG: putative tricarboxylic transport rane protein [Clostridia bacterium]|nr:putative tricarboxylic transport rane protein [Clostridia bacterium]